jgi:hypothetical protein
MSPSSIDCRAHAHTCLEFVTRLLMGVTDRAIKAWYNPFIANDPQTGGVTWQATSDDGNS